MRAVRSVAALDHLPTVFASEYAHWQSYPSVEIAPAEPSAESPADSPAKSPATPPIEAMASKILKLIAENPGKTTGYYARQARISGKRFAAIRQQLVALGLVREHTLATSGRGRPALVLEPRPAAFETLKQTAGRNHS